MIIDSFLAIPINEPAVPLNRVVMDNNYFFDQVRFTQYFLQQNNNKYNIFQDDHNQWYFIYKTRNHSLQQFKRNRQILRPSYLQNVHLPLIDLLNELGLEISDKSFDKAFGHALFYCDNINNLSTQFQLKIANFDGDDDPFVSSAMHYIENDYLNKKTRFIAGVETFSFATITESEYYSSEIWPNDTGLLYLLLFVYFQNYRIIPTKQMMGRLLCNLWASTQSLNYNFNDALFRKITL